MLQSIDPKSIESHLLEYGVEFAGLINKQGRVIDFMCKNEINISKEQKELFFMSTAYNLSKQKDFDDCLGDIEYIVTDRENSRIISIPMNFGSIMLIINRKQRSVLLAKKILKAVEYVKELNGQPINLEKSKSGES
jgi:hypothetical protein